ncbi:MAG TPA: hypothetical protein PKV71_13050 [Calditrichia bacterium]|nr:hypothetical protein [Calditrichota bacterium]HQU72666.1 hypothetical protein [Calditrichia bacterium]HQV32805.1 hypothetical protein [Calditrichia bacterium]
MEDRTSLVLNLAKYPIIVFSILIALVVAEAMLDIDFSRLTRISAGGIEFAEQRQETLEALSGIEERVNALWERVEVLEASSHGNISPQQILEIEQRTAEAAQMVSDETAKLARDPETASKTLLRGKSGYIWIGNWDSQNKTWSTVNLALPETGEGLTISPKDLKSGTRLVVTGNLVLRGGMPANDTDYYRGERREGVVPKGTQVLLRSVPEVINREYALQVWARVEIVE